MGRIKTATLFRRKLVEAMRAQRVGDVESYISHSRAAHKLLSKLDESVVH